MKKGVTLIEALVASLLMVIAISGVALAVTTYNAQIMEHVKRKEAAFVLQQELENIQALNSRQAIVDLYITPYTNFNNAKLDTVEGEEGEVLEIYNIYFKDASYPDLGTSGDLIDEGSATVLQFTAVAAWDNGDKQVEISTRCPN